MSRHKNGSLHEESSPTLSAEPSISEEGDSPGKRTSYGERSLNAPANFKWLAGKYKHNTAQKPSGAMLGLLSLISESADDHTEDMSGTSHMNDLK